MKTRTKAGVDDRAPILAPRIVTLWLTPGEEVVVEASTDLADWEVVAALERAAVIWNQEEE